jgi:hypothetical protein
MQGRSYDVIVVTYATVYEYLSPGGICRCAFTKQNKVVYILYTGNITSTNSVPRCLLLFYNLISVAPYVRHKQNRI